MKPHTLARDWINRIVLLAAGASLPLSMAPYEIWPLAIIAPAMLAVSIQTQPLRQTLLSCLLFGLGLFGHGASWVYVSIHDFGFTGMHLAVAMTFMFVAFLALVFCLCFYIYGRFKFLHASILLNSALFAAVWTLGEWLRSWLFTGFPWLYVGYAQINSPLAHWAPVGGVFLLSFLSVFSGIALWHITTYLLNFKRLGHRNSPSQATRAVVFFTASLVIIWSIPMILATHTWTKPVTEPQTISILQPNVELVRKWDPRFFPGILAELDEAANQYWQSDIQVWPEAAIPSVYNDIYSYIQDVNDRASATSTNVFSGVLYDNESPYEVYNSIQGLGLASGSYFKQKLVPFGEYVPFENSLRGLIAFFDLPNSVIRRGPFKPDALIAKTSSGMEYIVAPFICYEVVYPDFVAVNSRNANLLITISNDAWFGNSIGPFQHFEMVRMRALENQKYYARATNTGISAIVNERGEITAQGGQFKREVISGTVELRQGLTLFARAGSYPIIIACLCLVGLAFIRSRKQYD